MEIRKRSDSSFIVVVSTWTRSNNAAVDLHMYSKSSLHEHPKLFGTRSSTHNPEHNTDDDIRVFQTRIKTTASLQLEHWPDPLI